MEDSSSGNNDVFVKGRRMKMLHSTLENLSWLMRGKLSKDKSCLSLMDFITSSVTDSLKVFSVTQNTDKLLEITNQKKTTLLRQKKTHNFE